MSEGAEPAFLSIRQLLVLHETSLAEHGGIDGVREGSADVLRRQFPKT